MNLNFKSPVFKTCILIFIVIVTFKVAPAQDYTDEKSNDRPINLGVGLRIDYGGMGLRVSALPSKQIVLFAAGGYNFNDFGYNVGASFRFMPSKKNCLYYTLMYGYNTVLIVRNANQYNKTYYGPSTGIGIEIHRKKRMSNYWNFELLVPIRTEQYKDDIKNNPILKLESEPLPISISIGYHFS